MRYRAGKTLKIGYAALFHIMLGKEIDKKCFFFPFSFLLLGNDQSVQLSQDVV